MKTIKVQIPRTEDRSRARGTIDFPLGPALMLELRPWEREWLDENCRHGLLPHGLKDGEWQHSPLTAMPDAAQINGQHVATLIRDRMRQCISAKEVYAAGRELLSRWLHKFRPEKIHLFAAGTMTEQDVLDLRRDTLLPVPGLNPAIQVFQPLAEGDVDPCCDKRAVRFASEPYSGSLDETQDSRLAAVESEVLDRLMRAPWMSEDEFASEDLSFRIRLHQGWCSTCDPQRTRRAIRLGVVARLNWGPYTIEQEYALDEVRQ